jgi:hypothetical protein
MTRNPDVHGELPDTEIDPGDGEGQSSRSRLGLGKYQKGLLQTL